MKPDFTIRRYLDFLSAMKDQAYVFQPFSEYLKAAASRSIILRHDVDRLPEYALRFAQIQQEKGIVCTYYFRIVPESYSPEIIRKIASLGHEIGYHYEDMDLAYRKMKKTHKKASFSEEEIAGEAIESFQTNLTRLRKFYPVRSICMHGSPLSPYDNKLLWKYYDYHKWGIDGEPYFDLDYSHVLYLTDTGRRWDGDKFSVRDTLSSDTGHVPRGNLQALRTRFHSTEDIIRAARSGSLPDHILFTFHPQRWTNRAFPWIKECILQKGKNTVKYILIRHKKKS